MVDQRKYGKDFVNVAVGITPDEHKRFRLLSLEYKVSLGAVARMAWSDEGLWRRAAKIKAQERKAKG